MDTLKKNKYSSIATTCMVVAMLCFMIACSKKKPEIIAAVSNRTEIPRLHANQVTTLISDSGVTRYRISAPVWDIFDKAEPPYWEFPNGIHLERFDLALNVDANIHSDYAKYFEKDELWELKGNVDATNLEGERFETERLFWDQKSERIYSDTLIKITQTDQVIYGEEFESNQSLSKYTINRPYGIFPVKEEE